MSGTSSYNGPDIILPYVTPSNIPPDALSYIKPIYTALQNIVQTLIRFAGIAPRSPGDVLSLNGDPSTILASNVHRFYIQALEPIAQGAIINLVPSVGVLFVQNANATTGAKQADGFCSQVGGILAGGIGEVILNDGINNSFSTLTPGTRYYLSTVNGAISNVAPVAAGNLQQSVGIAINATTLYFFAGHQIQH